MASDPEEICESLRASRKDPEAFAGFYEAHADKLLAYFMGKVGKLDVALDLTAETMARAFLSRKRFRGRTDAEAAGWLYRIAKRQYVDYIRSATVERKAMTRLGLERPRITDSHEAELIELETSAELVEFLAYSLNQLPAEQRSVIELRFADGLRYREVAQRLKITEEAARARALRGLRSLRRLHEGWPGPAGPQRQDERDASQPAVAAKRPMSI